MSTAPSPATCSRSASFGSSRKPWAVNFNLPGKDFPTIGALASEMPEGHIKFFPIDLEKRSVEFKPGITIDLQPFPGTLAVGIDPDDPAPRKGGVKDDKLAPVSTLRPWKNGSNMDINELQEGSTLFIPVFQQGRADLDRRFALPPGQWRGQPDGARVLLQGDPDPADRAQGHEAELAVHRDQAPTGSRPA